MTARNILLPLALLALLAAGAIFGFFFAWVCSTMWGLDSTDPQVAIAAMQAMNASVRNPVFALAFFGTPVFLAAAASAAWAARTPRAALLFGLACALYLAGGLALTMMASVPMNEALASVKIPADTAAAGAIWSNYSAEWQLWNIARTAVCAIVLLLVGAAFLTLHDSAPERAAHG
ncbi:MAG: DUF1772 domain-containing protein [Rhodospirillaceae bacterium]|nr:DUF1772 domain-containing protein [Rhodospirillaceae bacterium]